MEPTVELDPLLGTTLGGRYLLRECIEQRGALRRYRAELLRGELPVLATVISARELDEGAIRRFRQTAERLKVVVHESCTPVLDFGREPDGPLFLIEPGDSWNDLARELARKRRLAPEEAIDLCSQLLRALQRLHEEGLAFGALSPAAVRLASQAAPQRVQLSTAMISFAAISPESQAAAAAYCGSNDGTVKPGTVASDLYAVGMLLAQMLTGQPPGPRALQLVQTDPRIPGAVGATAARATGTGERFVSAEQMLQSLTGDSASEARFGRYTLVERLATGGMGEIFLARAEEIEGLSRLCVIKTIRTGLAGEPGFVERFLAEARVVAALHHGNIVPVYDVGKFGDALYIAMEFVAGRDLHKLLRALREQGRRIPLPLALFIAREVANGLAYAHRAKVHGMSQLVHRDVSPQNVLVSFEGEVKLIDFGLARGAHGRVTDEGVVVGKVCYLSPEQARAEPLDQRTDIYALGLVLFEMLVGDPFFNQETIDEVMALVPNPVIRPPSSRAADIPREIDRLCLRAMAPEPERRYPSASELRDDLSAELARIAPRTNQEEVGDFLKELFPEEHQEEGRRLSEIATNAAADVSRGDDLLGASLLGKLPTPIRWVSAAATLRDAPTLTGGPRSPLDTGAVTRPSGRLPEELVEYQRIVPTEPDGLPRPPPAAAAAPLQPQPTFGGRREARRDLLRVLLVAVGVTALVVGGLFFHFARRPRPPQAEPALGLQIQAALADASRTPAAAVGAEPDAAVAEPDAAGARMAAGDGPAADGATGQRLAPRGPASCYLVVVGGVRGMRLYVDGAPRGVLPIQQRVPLAANRAHAIEIRHPRFDPRRWKLRAADCGPGAESELMLSVK